MKVDAPSGTSQDETRRVEAEVVRAASTEDNSPEEQGASVCRCNPLEPGLMAI